MAFFGAVLAVELWEKNHELGVCIAYESVA